MNLNILLYSMLEFLPTTGKREADLGYEIFPFHPASRTVYDKSREIDIVITDMAYELACKDNRSRSDCEHVFL